jgi:uncharacterized membrane protein YtjA (UPF0391 family)
LAAAFNEEPDSPFNFCPFGLMCGTFGEREAFHCNKMDSGASLMGNLLHYAIVFLVVAIIAALFGFGGVAGTAMEGARLLFWVAIVLFVVALVANFVRRA